MWRRAPLVLICLIATLRLWWWPLWEDELWTWALSHMDLSRALELSRLDKHPPLYFLTTWFTGRLGGHSDWSLRLPSAIGAVVAVATTVAAARRVAGERAALLAGLAAAASPFLALYSGIARAYGIVAGLGGGLLLCSVALPSAKRPWLWAAAAAGLGAIGLYTHYATLEQLAAYGLGAAVATVVSRRDLSDRLRRLGAATVAVAAALLAFVPWYLGPFADQAQRQLQVPRTLSVLRYLSWPVAEYRPWTGWMWFALFAAGAVIALRRRRPEHGALIGWVIAALVLPWLASSTMDAQWKTYIHIGFLPVSAVLVGIALDAAATRFDGLPQRTVVAVAAAVPLLLALPGQRMVFGLPSAPLGYSLLGAGPYDVEQEVGILVQLDPDFHPRAVDDRPFSPYARYAPAGGAPADWPAPQDKRQWKGWERTRSNSGGNALQPPYRRDCAFEWAFGVILYIQPVPQCLALRDIIAAEAERTNSPALWMEVADRARFLGHMDVAEHAASMAEAHTLSSSAPAVFLASLYLDTGRPEDALEAADDAISMALRWNDRLTVQTLLSVKARALEQLGRTDEAERALDLRTCAVSRSPFGLCGTGLARLFNTGNAR